MWIGLTAVDGRGDFPNLALMRLSTWHKRRRDAVDWWNVSGMDTEYCHPGVGSDDTGAVMVYSRSSSVWLVQKRPGAADGPPAFLFLLDPRLFYGRVYAASFQVCRRLGRPVGMAAGVGPRDPVRRKGGMCMENQRTQNGSEVSSGYPAGGDQEDELTICSPFRWFSERLSVAGWHL